MTREEAAEKSPPLKSVQEQSRAKESALIGPWGQEFKSPEGKSQLNTTLYKFGEQNSSQRFSLGGGVGKTTTTNLVELFADDVAAVAPKPTRMSSSYKKRAIN